MKKRTTYNLSHQVATAGTIGALVPTCRLEVAPGDTFSGKVGLLVRLAPLKRALLQDIYVDQFFFYVPHRLVMSDWENFIADGPMDTPTYSVPTVTIGPGGVNYRSLWQEPPSATDSKEFSALPLYATNLIWNEYFRDDNFATRNPTDSPGQWGISVAYKKSEYWANVRADIGESQDIHYFDTNVGSGTEASALDVLRALAKQKISMKRATYGTRYIDILRSYGVSVNYQMLQRPELVATAHGAINVTDVVSTSNDGGSDLGAMAGHGISGSRLTIRRKAFPEHGQLLGFVVLRGPQTDPNFIDWFDKPRDYTSFYDPGLVPLPPVAVTRGDVTGACLNANDSDAFGYQPWGEWYRKALSRSHATISDWAPNVGFTPDSFTAGALKSVDPTDYGSLFNDTSQGQFQVSALNHLRVNRLLPRATTMSMSGIPSG